MARNGRMWGGMAAAFFFGALFLSWFINTFFIYPLLIPGGYVLNILTVLTFANPLAVISFVVVAALIYLGYVGAVFTKRGRGR